MYNNRALFLPWVADRGPPDHPEGQIPFRGLPKGRLGHLWDNQYPGTDHEGPSGQGINGLPSHQVLKNEERRSWGPVDRVMHEPLASGYVLLFSNPSPSYDLNSQADKAC